ncbi:MAG: CTP synthase [Defluviitaleaceae bacterium]|nr:CTP synthase [Defluviitaleaceae bacterium]
MKKTKFVFVTGGVASGLGKGITAASLGRLLKARGFSVANQKFDPYINIDPSLMSPIQHGEVFVTDDGAECDADVGHYERFTDENLDANSNITSGKIYQTVIDKERKGEYQGKTVQVIPHITNHIKYLAQKVVAERAPDVVITEIGGTVGDIESHPFIEAIRQMGFDAGRENVLYVHVTLLPYLQMGGELKTKPTQHSVKELLSMGIQPDMIVCRTEIELTDEIKGKIALFCNVSEDCIIQNLDADNIYRLPLMLEKENFAKMACKKLGLQVREPDLSGWQVILDKAESATLPVKISIVGKYVELPDAYLSLVEALKSASFEAGAKLEIKWVESDGKVEKGDFSELEGSAGIVIPGGFGVRGFEGKVKTARYARENGLPCLGLGMGMQAMVIEFARHVLELDTANSTEFDPSTTHPIFTTLGEHLRKGAHAVEVAPATLAHAIYGEVSIRQRHRHRYGFDHAYTDRLNDAGLTISGKNEGGAAEIVEIDGHPFYLGALFHPEFTSRPSRPHPMFIKFFEVCVNGKA